ncbi:MAG: PEGA domain-containing protein [Deltaproteobacteria bacterium]|nr:PEGA domain-containing protein [Deltaproteobacteria bacterium]
MPKAKPRRRSPALIAALTALLATELGCAHTVQVQSKPAGATIYVNGRRLGKAPIVFEEEASDQHRETIVTARLNGFETTEVRLVRSEPNPWAAWMLTPFCGTLGWAAGAVSLVAGVVTCLPTAGCGLLIGPAAAAIMAGAGCVWIVATSPTLLLLRHMRRLPDRIVVELPPTGAINQSDDGSSPWLPAFVDSPEEDNYWQNPKPVPEERRLPPPTQSAPASAPSTMGY